MSEELEFVLRRLGDENRPVRSISLAPLSDLPRDQVGVFREAWAALAAERRLELTTELVEQAEGNVHLNFCAILRDCLQDEDARVRKLAVEGLWEDCRPNLVTSLVALLADDPSPDVRAAAAISLGRFVLMGELGEVASHAAAQAVEALRAAWFRPRELNEVRRRALEGMSYTGQPEVQEFIQNAYYDEDESMRQSAVFAMGRSGDRRWTRSVLAELGSQDAAMRFEAAAAAGELGLSPAVRPLVRLLDDPDSSVREAAALALGQIGGAEARRALRACAAGADERLAQAAEEALEELAFNAGSIDQPLFDFDGAGPDGSAVADDKLMDGEDEFAVALGGPFDDTGLLEDDDDDDDEEADLYLDEDEEDDGWLDDDAEDGLDDEADEDDEDVDGDDEDDDNDWN